MRADSEQAILLVEDDVLLRDAFRLLLEDAGFRVLPAGSAGEALKRIDEQHPAIIILDLGLPDRPGLELTRELRLRDSMKDIPIVALTGRVGAAEKRACLEAGCSLYLAKPIGPRDLLVHIRELLA